MMRKNIISFLLFAFAVLLANACFATSYNKMHEADFNPSSDFAYVIESSSAIVNKKTNKSTSTYSNYQLWIKNQFGAKYYYHYLQNAVAKKNALSNKENLKLDYFLNSYSTNKTPFDEVDQVENTSSNAITDELTDSAIPTSSNTESKASPPIASLTSTDNDLKEYIDQELSPVEIVNPFSTNEEESVFDFINLDDDHLLLLAKGLIGLLALLTIYAIIKKVMHRP